MIVQQLDGTYLHWKLEKKINENASKLHCQVRELLYNLFPTDFFYEEVTVPLNRKNKVYLDFFNATHRKAIEVQGEQHYKRFIFFHTTQIDYLKAKNRDNLKKRWCELNNIQFVELRFDEDEESWKNKILS